MPKIVGRFCKRIVAPKRAFDRRSFRWKKSGRAWVLVGCPKGKWKRDRCTVGLKAHELLVKSSGRCAVGKVVTKGPGGARKAKFDLKSAPPSRLGYEYEPVDAGSVPLTSLHFETSQYTSGAMRQTAYGGPKDDPREFVAGAPYKRVYDRISGDVKYYRRVDLSGGLRGPRKTKAASSVRSDTSYRGFYIEKHPFTGEWLISKDGHKYGAKPSLKAAKAAIDTIA